MLVKVWVLLKLQSIVFFYKVDCPLFLPFLQLFLFHFFLFSGPKIAWGVFGLIGSLPLLMLFLVLSSLGGGLVGSRVCFDMESDT